MISPSQSSSVSSSLELHGAAASSSRHSVVHLDSSAILYASNCIINIATPHSIDDHDHDANNNKDSFSNKSIHDSVVYTVKQTIRTESLSRADNDWSRSITAITLLNSNSSNSSSSIPQRHGHPRNQAEESSSAIKIVACAFSDGTITTFCIRQSTSAHIIPKYEWDEHIIVGTSDTDAVTPDATPNGNASADPRISIADITGCYTGMDMDTDTINKDLHNNSYRLQIIAASAKGVHCYHHSIHTNTISHTYHTKAVITCIGNYPTSTVEVITIDNQILLTLGTALPRNNRVHFYTMPLDSFTHNIQQCASDVQEDTPGVSTWKHQGSVMGHLDWVSCLDWNFDIDIQHQQQHHQQQQDTHNDNSFRGGMLASGSQDARIRLWKLHPPAVCDNGNDNENNNDTMNNDNEEDDDEDLIEEGEARMYIRYVDSKKEAVQIAVTLEALLMGHEEGVTSVRWRPNSDKPCLISASMDRSILIWMEEEDADDNLDRIVSSGMHGGTGNVWIPITRVGTAGGVLGGSIASSLLGFVNVLWSYCGRQIVGHGFGGALYFWSRADVDGDVNVIMGPSNVDHKKMVQSSAMERWHAAPGITGHFRGCSDISWEATEGMYLLSVGMDQTCRLWMQLTSSVGSDSGVPRVWKEVGRPQVHGYDLNTITCIGTGIAREKDRATSVEKGEMLHRFVSGADEKEARAFDAPIQTMELIKSLGGTSTRIDTIADREERIDRAFIPSLGLSNRANLADAMEEGAEVGLTKTVTDTGSTGVDADCDKHDEDVPVTSITQALPTERDLGVASLWPEVRKLFGHWTEMVCLTSTAQHWKETDTDKAVVLVASSCKARDAEKAAIRIWNVEKNVCLDVLKNGHKSTVVTMRFSPDGGKYLASAGKDRRLVIWSRVASNEGEIVSFRLAAIVESAHKRIIWSTDFCSVDSTILATGSRDGHVKIWRVQEQEESSLPVSGNSNVAIEEIYNFQPLCKADKKVEPVTAVAFAPRGMTMNINGMKVRHGIIAVGVESGLIEIWAVPLIEGDWSAAILHSIPVQDCHLGVVKKLAWRPAKENESVLTLASCGSDNGVRLFSISLISWTGTS